MVRRAKSFNLGFFSLGSIFGDCPTLMATTASATASSSLDGSKKIFSPTEMTRRVTGGLDFRFWFCGCVRVDDDDDPGMKG